MNDLQNNPGAQLVALYLPQFHPIPENDAWWGKGFTEWTNVAKAKPTFPGHYQPHIPADLGFYDLRLGETRVAQAQLAQKYGVGGFCYYHYWFTGRRVLERPFADVLSSGQPDFPFCLCWANENWSRRWDGSEHEILLEQKYSAADDIAHARSLMPAFADERYIRIDGKPLFLIYRTGLLPDARASADRWRDEARKAGLPGLYMVCVESFSDESIDPRTIGFDASLEFQPRWGMLQQSRIARRKWWHRRKLGTGEKGFYLHNVYHYEEVVERALAHPQRDHARIRCVSPSWDNTARRAAGANILHGSTPALYQHWLEGVLQQVAADPHAVRGANGPLVFVNAWNEWAEGNHLEPCAKWGHGYLEATRAALATMTHAPSPDGVLSVASR